MLPEGHVLGSPVDWLRHAEGVVDWAKTLIQS